MIYKFAKLVIIFICAGFYWRVLLLGPLLLSTLILTDGIMNSSIVIKQMEGRR